MTIKQQVLNELLKANGKSVSGQVLAEKLFCSRNAIWKAIKTLQSEGYEICATTNKGYWLDTNELTIEKINEQLKTKCKIILLKSVDSTNNYLKIIAEKGGEENTVVIAKSQTKGKGRMGRNFFSDNCGVYMSLLLRPSVSASKSLFITTAAAVAVANAVETVTGNDTKIKWVNDIFVNGKKVCGILTEASIDFETGGLCYAVLGIGINIKKPKNDFPKEIREIAGVISEKSVDSSLLIAEILNNFFEIYNNFEKSNFMSEYKSKSMVTGKDIFVLRGEEKRPAKAIDIDDKARLLVEYENGEREYLSSGEVSVRL
ncbi:MAG: biotin--[Clostridia bacterium]|nr:biotin--[acetyl-CoA-carboxylase] ligase [Clostridia bacterium]